MVDPSKTYTIQELIRNAACTRANYDRDVCVRHRCAWPYDEAACNVIIGILGETPRRYLGDGRATGEPHLPVTRKG